MICDHKLLLTHTGGLCKSKTLADRLLWQSRQHYCISWCWDVALAACAHLDLLQESGILFFVFIKCEIACHGVPSPTCVCVCVCVCVVDSNCEVSLFHGHVLL